MAKAGAAKLADILIPQNEKFLRFRRFLEIQFYLDSDAVNALNYGMTMFTREADFIRYLRMASNSYFMTNLYEKIIVKCRCNEVIYLPMIDGINIDE